MKIFATLLCAFVWVGAQGDPAEGKTRLEAQTAHLLKIAGEPTGENFPRTEIDGKFRGMGIHDWTSGFFPGSLWYLYELTGEERWRAEAERWTAPLEPLKSYRKTHDLGFMVYCSFGNAERLASRPEYRAILVEAAESLASRFNPTAGVIRSWDWPGRSWDGVAWKYPVIIDNMMNLELLFYASRVTGDPKFREIAIRHADTTMKNHFREDASTYHVVDYDPETGQVRARCTAQGYSDNSTWARGQAWAIYGYTMTYRETGDRRYLKMARRAADVYLRNLPEDLIPLWDLNVGQEGFTPGKNSYAREFQGADLRDASAGAVVCSALFELSELSGNKRYRRAAQKMLESLGGEKYLAEVGTNSGFLLRHSVGSIPGRFEIDVPLVYADYYYLEALLRSEKAKSK